MVGVTTTVKIFIDIFIGVWAFLLAYIWTRHIEPRQGGDSRQNVVTLLGPLRFLLVIPEWMDLRDLV